MSEKKSDLGDLSIEDRIPSVRLIAFDFDGVFTDNTVYVFENGLEAVRCWRSDGIGLKILKELGIGAVVISTETNSVVTRRCNKLGIECVQACEDKRGALEEIARERGISMEEVAFVGNDVNDLACLACVGAPIVVQDTHPSLLPHACYRTKAKGGFGAVREVCDLFESVLLSKKRVALGRNTRE